VSLLDFDHRGFPIEWTTPTLAKQNQTRCRVRELLGERTRFGGPRDFTDLGLQHHSCWTRGEKRALKRHRARLNRRRNHELVTYELEVAPAIASDLANIPVPDKRSARAYRFADGTTVLRYT
jgi:hypothetical protein